MSTEEVDDEKSNAAVVDSSPMKSDVVSHLMHCGLRDYQAGKLDSKPMLCLGWLYFKEKVDFGAIKEKVMTKLVSRVKRYRCTIAERDGWSYWDPLPVGQIDMEYHFHHVKRKFETDGEFTEYLEKISEEGLDYSKPLWRYVLIDQLACGRCAVLGFTDHIFADGASQMSALLSLCENGGNNPVFQKKMEQTSETKISEKKSNKVQGKTKKTSRKMTAFEKLGSFCKGFATPLSEALTASDAATKLKLPDENPFPRGWKFATTKPDDQMDLKLIKDIKNQVGNGCTVNDVLLCLTALAIRDYYIDINDPIMSTNKDITATYAVNTRPYGVDYLSDKWFGNHIVVATTDYPLHDEKIATLMKFMKASRSRKMSPENAVRSFLMKSLANYCPRDKIVQIGAEVTVKYSIMISNVLLSTTPLKLFGQTIDDVQFLAFAPLGCYCGVATYNNRLNCNIVVAKECESNPNEIMPYYNKELKELHKIVMGKPGEFFDVLDKPETPGAAFYSVVLAIALLILSLFIDLNLSIFHLEKSANASVFLQ